MHAAELTATGRVAPGASATLYLNDEPQALTVAADGSFTAALLLRTGPNHFFVVEDGTSPRASQEVRVMRAELEWTDLEGHWAREYVLSLAARAVVQGYPDPGDDTGRSFCPDKTISRGEFVVLLSRALSMSATASLEFEDADAIPTWMRSAMAAAVSRGIITGYEDNTLRVEAPLTRAEMAVMLTRALGELEPPQEGWGDEPNAIPFQETALVPHWAHSEVQAAYHWGLMVGDNESNFQPQVTATRAQAAAVIFRALAILQGAN